MRLKDIYIRILLKSAICLFEAITEENIESQEQIIRNHFNWIKDKCGKDEDLLNDSALMISQCKFARENTLNNALPMQIADEFFQEALKLNPNDLTLLINSYQNKVFCAYQFYNLEECRKIVEETSEKMSVLLADNPECESALLCKIKGFVALGKRESTFEKQKFYFDRALEELEKVSELSVDLILFWAKVLRYKSELFTDNTRDSLCEEAFAKYEQASQLEPQNSEVFDDWGEELLEFAESKEITDIAKYDLLKQAIEKFDIAIKTESDKSELVPMYLQSGFAYLEMSRCKSCENVTELFNIAQKQFAAVRRLYPLNSNCRASVYYYSAYSKLLQNDISSAETFLKKAFKVGGEKVEETVFYDERFSTLRDTELFKWLSEKYAEYDLLCEIKEFVILGREESAFEKKKFYFDKALEEFEKVSKLSADLILFWVKVLRYKSELFTDNAKDSLYKEIFAKYEEASKLEPKNPQILTAWGKALLEFAESKETTDIAKYDLLKQAAEKFDAVIKMKFNKFDISEAYLKSGVARLEMSRCENCENITELFDTAQKRFATLMRLYPFFVNARISAYYYSAYLKLLQNDTSSAETFLRKAFKVGGKKVEETVFCDERFSALRDTELFKELSGKYAKNA